MIKDGRLDTTIWQLNGLYLIMSLYGHRTRSKYNTNGLRIITILSLEFEIQHFN